MNLSALWSEFGINPLDAEKLDATWVKKMLEVVKGKNRAEVDKIK